MNGVGWEKRDQEERRSIEKRSSYLTESLDVGDGYNRYGRAIDPPVTARKKAAFHQKPGRPAEQTTPVNSNFDPCPGSFHSGGTAAAQHGETSEAEQGGGSRFGNGGH